MADHKRAGGAEWLGDSAVLALAHLVELLLLRNVRFQFGAEDTHNRRAFLSVSSSALGISFRRSALPSHL